MECHIVKLSEGAPFIADERVIYYISTKVEEDFINFYLSLEEALGRSSTIRIVYFPFLVETIDQNALVYNFPNLKVSKLEAMDFYRDSYQFLGIEPLGESRHIVRFDQSSDAFLCFDLSAPTAEEFFEKLRSASSIIKPKSAERVSHMSYNISGPDLLGSLPEGRQIEELKKISRDTSFPADERYDVDQRISELEAKRIIQRLIMDDFPIAIIEGWMKDALKPSPLVITKDNRIMLPNFDLEIRLHPLEKTVYFFFLRHEEGCRFKELENHKKELLEIYDRIAGIREPNAVQKSIDDLCSVWGTSINEKCSRIKKAFITQFGERLASLYYITGTKGSPKKIELDRSLVTWE